MNGALSSHASQRGSSVDWTESPEAIAQTYAAGGQLPKTPMAAGTSLSPSLEQLLPSTSSFLKRRGRILGPVDLQASTEATVQWAGCHIAKATESHELNPGIDSTSVLHLLKLIFLWLARRIVV